MSPLPATYKRIIVREHPTGDIDPVKTFRTETVPFPTELLLDGQVLVRVTWLSLDPAMRGWLRDVRSYIPPVPVGAVMRSFGLGIVEKVGKGSQFKVGDRVSGGFGWTEFAIMKEKDVMKLILPPGVEPLDYLSTLGLSGMTAYFGLRDIGRLKPGEKLLVSGAAGSVGMLVCQLGKRAGAKVYALAGTDDKCRWLEKELGVDRAFNYKSPNFRKEIKEMGYLDVYFDNVGGEILDMAMSKLNKFARIIMCGAVSQYNTTRPAGVHNYLALVSQRATMQGFVVSDYTPEFPNAIKELSAGLADGSIVRKFHVVEGGLEKAPVALPMLFSGGNTGKLVVKVAAEPQTSKL